MTVLRAAAAVGSLTMVSRLTGFVRDVLIAAALGASPAADAFFVSFKLANLFRRLFAEGAFGAAFVPLFTRALAEDGKTGALDFARSAAGLLLAIQLPLVLLAELLMPWLVRVIATGFPPGGERFTLAVELSRITFPYLACISLAALAGAVLNGLDRFAAAAVTPVLLNLVLIAALGLAALFGLAPVRVLAWGVAVAGLVQLTWLWLATARLGFALVPRPFHADQHLRRFFALLMPGIGGAGVGQIMLVMNSWFASHLPPGAIAHLFYADRLVQLPIGLVGVALGTALLPALTRAVRAGRPAEARSILNGSLVAALLLTLPAAAGLLVLAEPIIRVLFQRGAFDPAATAATAATLQAMAVGLPPAILGRVLAPAFFAREDTRTPVRAALVSLAGNIVLIPLLIGPMAEAGIALAGSLATWGNAALLVVVLYRRGELAVDPALTLGLTRLLVALAAMLACLLLLRPLLASWPEPMALAGLVGAGTLSFLAAAGALGALRGLGQPALGG